MILKRINGQVRTLNIRKKGTWHSEYYLISNLVAPDVDIIVEINVVGW